jgi:hypothetical protein
VQLIELDLAGNRLGYPAAVSVARFAQRVYRERSVRLAALSLQENRSALRPLASEAGTKWAHPTHICAGTGLTPPTSVPGLGSPRPHLRRDWAHPSTSAPDPAWPFSLGPRWPDVDALVAEDDLEHYPHSEAGAVSTTGAPVEYLLSTRGVPVEYP